MARDHLEKSLRFLGLVGCIGLPMLLMLTVADFDRFIKLGRFGWVALSFVALWAMELLLTPRSRRHE